MVAMRLPFLKSSAADIPPIVAMTGVRLGDSVVFSGRSPRLVVPLGAKTGLSGRCLAVGNSELTAMLSAAASEAGVLLETSDIFPSDPPFDLAVIEVADEQLDRAATARPAVRSGGRIILVVAAEDSGLLSRLRSRAPSIDPESLVGTLTRQGWQRARVIGTADRMTFVEAFR